MTTTEIQRGFSGEAGAGGDDANSEAYFFETVASARGRGVPLVGEGVMRAAANDGTPWSGTQPTFGKMTAFRNLNVLDDQQVESTEQ